MTINMMMVMAIMKMMLIRKLLMAQNDEMK